MEEDSISGLKILTHFLMGVPMVTVYPGKNFSYFIFSNKFLLTILLFSYACNQVIIFFFCLALPDVEYTLVLYKPALVHLGYCNKIP
jgi:hypothetical protein